MKLKHSLVASLLLTTGANAIDLENLQIYGYGNINYSNYDYVKNTQMLPKNRNKVDLERFVIISRYMLSDTVTIVSELEYEHGGTGSTMEIELDEEGGEIEQEIEKGGEIVLEELNVVVTTDNPWLNYRVGHMLVGVGMVSARHLPNLYHSAYYNRSESRIIPTTWHETGLEIFGTFDEKFHYQAQVLTGLNSELFGSAGWIKEGMQTRFESVHADNLATVLRLSYGDLTGNQIGFSYYLGDTGDNRNKKQLDIDATVQIFSAHGIYSYEDLTIRGLFMLGTLSDSLALRNANKSISPVLRVRRYDVAKEAIAYFVEAGYDISKLIGLDDNPLILWGKYDFSDTMHKTVSGILEQDYYEESTISGGINYQFSENIMLKTEYATTALGGKDSKYDMQTFTASLAFQF